MNHETISKFFQSTLGQQCNSLFTTDDDEIFIRYEEAFKHSQDNNLDTKLIMEWFEEWSGSDITPQVRNIIAFIEEKSITRGWENAEHLAGVQFGEDNAREAIIVMGKSAKLVKNRTTNLPDNSIKYFTDMEIFGFKSGSIPFPLICYDGTNQNNVTEVTEIVSIGGMADNNGNPTEITMLKHRKNQLTQKLVYKLTSTT